MRTLTPKTEAIFKSMQERNNGRRSTDRELSHLRRLERIVRTYITHFDDEPIKERFAPRTREMVKDAKAVCDEVDELRRPRVGAAGSKPAA